MRDFHSIIKVLKNYLAYENEKKILDKDIASKLEMTPSKFATTKKRNVLPYEAILEFCKKEKLCCMKVFFE